MVFIVDDNFIGNKKRTKAAAAGDDRLAASACGPSMGFLTEASVNLADDAELCELMVQAGFKKVFVGIETPSVEALEECRKLQNRGPRPGGVRPDPAARRPGGHGRVHRRLRQRQARTFSSASSSSSSARAW